MDTQTLISTAWTKAEGEVFTDAVGSDNYKYLLTLANSWIRRWGRLKGVDWFSLYEQAYNVGTISATDTYEYDNTEVRKISQENGDSIQILHTDGVNYTNYTLISADQLRQYQNQGNYGNVVAKIGSSLVFPRAFVSTDPQFNGTLNLPVFLYPAILVNPTDIVPVDDPEWLVSKVAADVASKDILRKDTAAIYSAEADDSLEAMKQDNEGQLNTLSAKWRPFTGSVGYPGNYNGYPDGGSGLLN